jgi:hypothetical protein
MARLSSVRHAPRATANANLAGAFRPTSGTVMLRCTVHRRGDRGREDYCSSCFHMFAGGYGGNRIKCRIAHHDPVLSFGLGLGIRLACRQAVIIRARRIILSPECHNGERKPSYPLVRWI